MRITLALALLLLPGAAFAQGEMPAGPIPVHKCVQTSEGTRCSPVQDGAGFAAADGYTRIYNWNGTTTSQQAMSVQQGPEGPTMER
jgi:hypothetical protein